MYSSIMPRNRSTVATAGGGVRPSHIFAFTSVEISHSVISRYLLPLELVFCAALRVSRKPSNTWPLIMAAS